MRSYCLQAAVGWVIDECAEFQKNKLSHCHGKFMSSKHYKTQNAVIHSLPCNRIPCLLGRL